MGAFFYIHMTDRLDQLLTFLERNPRDTFILFALARECMKTEDIEGAIAYYNRVIEIDSEYTGAYYHKGSLLAELEQIEEARVVLELGLSIALRKKEENDVRELRQVLLNLDI